MLTKLASFRALSKEFYKTVAYFHCMAFHRIAIRFDPARVIPYRTPCIQTVRSPARQFADLLTANSTDVPSSYSLLPIPCSLFFSLHLRQMPYRFLRPVQRPVAVHR
jgi:hypothetical protein